MSDMSIRFRALTHNKLLINAPIIIKEVEAYVDAFTNKELARAQNYPPERPNQKYVRTFRLQRGWKIERRYQANALIVRLKSEGVIDERGRRYATMVQGNEQWPIHAETGWPIIEKTIDRAAFRRGLMQIYKKRGV